MNDAKHSPSSETSLERIEAAVSLLNQHPDFRVISRFDPQELHIDPIPVSDTIKYLVVADTEATGIDIVKDAIVELGLVKVAYCSNTHEVLGVVGVFEAFDDPGIPISPEASAVNQITDDMVAGCHIEEQEVLDFLQDVELIVCHNSSFDRPLLERRFPSLQVFRFACSLRAIDWNAVGIGGGKLDYIAYRLGFFFEGHRAAVDCLALTRILKTAVPFLPDMTFLALMLAETDKVSYRIWAKNSPFDVKDSLKSRGYRWSDGTIPGTEKAWFIEVDEDDFEQEKQWLSEFVYQSRKVALPVDKVDATYRYSLRRAPTSLVYL